MNTSAVDADLLRRYRYLFDLGGNRTQEIATVGVTTTTNDYEYTSANQIDRRRVNAGAWTNFSYDNNGNLTNDGTNTYTWDRANRLKQRGLNYTYDGYGNRFQQTAGDATKYLLDIQPGLSEVIREEDTGSHGGFYGPPYFVHGSRGLHAFNRVNSGSGARYWTWPLEDGLGSVRVNVDSTGGVLESRNYDPYGNSFNPTGTSQTDYGFTGGLTDDNGLLYLRARYYNPTVGVFPSLDPFRGMADRPMNLNGYSWVEGNVVNAVDPSGMIYELPTMWANCLSNFGISVTPTPTPTKCQCFTDEGTYNQCRDALRNPSAHIGFKFCDGTINGTSPTPLSPSPTSNWSCVANSPNKDFYSHVGPLGLSSNLWTCDGQGCQEWLDEAHCIFKEGFPGYPPTEYSKEIADGLIFNSRYRALGIRISFNYDDSAGGKTAGRTWIRVPSEALNTVYMLDHPSLSFRAYMGILTHEYYHSSQAGIIPAITHEIEAFIIQTLIEIGLGVTPPTWRIGLVERFNRVPLDPSTPYCDLCWARKQLMDNQSDDYMNYLLADTPFAVTSLVCSQYQCP